MSTRANQTIGRKRGQAAGGFALLAALGVALLLGIFLMLLGSVVRGDTHGKLQLEARTLAQLFALAAAEARYAGRALAWTADDTGYSFWQLNADNNWVELRDSEKLRPRSLPRGIRIAGLELERRAVDGVKRIEFAAYGAIPDFAVGLMLDSVQYQVTASTRGEFTAFPIDGSSRETMALR